MRDSNSTRAYIADQYAGAVSGNSAPLIDQTGAAAYADYGAEINDQISADVLESSFGCGNPLAFAGIKKGDIVLDLGCGGGLDLILAAEAVGRTGQVIGVDMTKAMVDKASAAVAAAGKFNVEVRHGVIENLPVDSNSVDWVISNCVINLSPEKEKVFGEIARVLRPGGMMSVSDIVVERLPWWAKSSKALYSACVSGAIAEHRYVTGLSAAGLIDVKVTARQNYDPAQIRAFLDAYIPKRFDKVKLANVSLADIIKNRLVKYATGNVWSAKFTAQKPRMTATDSEF